MRNLKMVANFILAKLEYRLLRTKLISYPYFALIDPSSVCTLHCPLCPTGLGDMSRPRMFMKFDEYKKIIDQIGDYLLSIVFTHWGEPFLNKELMRIIDYTKHVKRVPFTSVDTNLNVGFSDKDIEDLVRSDLDLMLISVDGATQETYEKYRRGGKLQVVIDNSKLILEKRKELGKDRPFVVWQFLVMKQNEHELDKVLQLAKETGVDALRISAAQVWVSDADKPFKESYEASTEYMVDLGSEYSIYTADGKRKRSLAVCQWLWKGVVINSDSGVHPCCVLFSKKYDFGDVLKVRNFREIWNNKCYQDARRAVKDPAYAKKLFDEKSGNVCVSCTTRQSGRLSE